MELKKSPNLAFKDYDFNKEYFSDEKDSIFSIKSEEIKKLDEPRPVGISGHIRAKDEGYSIAQCIESCVEVFDELIITVQPFFNNDNIDETYEICKKYKEKYPDKIKLFYYTPEVATISYFKDTNYYNPNGLPDSISDTSIHSFAHYCNFGLKEISYKYYMRVDADQIYLTNKLKKLRDAIVYSDRFTKPHRSFMNKAFGKIFQPFHNLFYSVLPLKSYISLLTWINKKCIFGMSGFQLTLAGGANLSASNKHHLKPLNPDIYKQELLDFFVPLSLCYNRFYCTNGGIDTCIFTPNSKNLYQYFKDHGVEMQNLVGGRAIRNLGFFWFHLGMLKRNYFVTGKCNHDYISLKDFLKSTFKKLQPKIQTKALYKDDYNSFWDNLRLNFDKDKKYAQEFLQQRESPIKS